MDRKKLYRYFGNSEVQGAINSYGYRQQENERLRSEAEEAKKKQKKAEEQKQAAYQAQLEQQEAEEKKKKQSQKPAYQKWADEKPAQTSTGRQYAEGVSDFVTGKPIGAEKDFNSFLASQRNKMYDTVLRKQNSLREMLTGDAGEDYKVNNYIKLTTDKNSKASRDKQNQIDKASAISDAREGLTPYVAANVKKPDGYWVGDWIHDAWGIFGESMNQAQADAEAGIVQQTNWGTQMSAAARKETLGKLQIEAIDGYMTLSDLYYNQLRKAGKTGKIDRQVINGYNSAIDRLKEFYKGITPENADMYYNQMMSDKQKLQKLVTFGNGCSTISKMDVSTFSAPGHPLRKLGIWFHDKDSWASKITGAISSVTGNYGDWFGDRVDESMDALSGWDTASNRQRLKMLDDFDKRLGVVKQRSEKLRDVNLQEKATWMKEHQVSDYFRSRVQKGNERLSKGESMWNEDNLLYSQVQQLGFSSSSWDKQAVTMALQVAATVASGGSSLSLQTLGAGASLAGAGLQYQMGAEENNAQIIEDLKTRVEKSLKGADKDQKTYNAVMAEGRKQFPGLSDDEILDKITHGQWLPNNSKALHSMQQSISTALDKAREGIRATYERDMAAVGADAMFNALLYGTKLGTKAVDMAASATTKVIGKTAQIIGKPLTQLPKGAGAAINKALSNQVGYRFARRRLSKGVADVMEKASPIGQYASLAAGAGKVIYNAASIPLGKPLSKFGEVIVNQGKKVVDPIMESNVGKMFAENIDRAIEFGRNIPLKLLAKTSPEGAFMLERLTKRVLLGKESKDMFGRTVRQGGVLGFGNKIIASGFSEAIEEGKQYKNGDDWIKNANPNEVETLYDILLRDSQLGIDLAPAAAGLPFGFKWGIGGQNELYSNMAGGWLGGALHNSQVKLASTALNLVTSPNRISIDKAIATNALLGRNNALTRFSKGAQLSARLGNSNQSIVAHEMDAYREFNKKRKEQGLSYIEDDILQEEQDFINEIHSVSRSAATKKAAKSAGIKVGSEQYHQFVSALALYNGMRGQQLTDVNNTDSQAEQLLNEIVATAFHGSAEEAAMAASILGDEEGTDMSNNPIVELFRHKEEEKPQQQEDHKGETKKQREKRKVAEHNAQLEAQLQEQIDQTVGRESDTTKQESNEQVYRRGASIIAKLAALTEYLNTIDTLDKYSEKRKKHDVRFMKESIKEEIKKLQEGLDPITVQKILADPSSYFENQEQFEALKELYQQRMGQKIELDVTDMMTRLLKGKAVFGTKKSGLFNKHLSIVLKGFKLSKATDVLDRLNGSIESDEEFIDSVNKEFEARNYSKEEQQNQPSQEQTQENQEADDFISASEQAMQDDQDVEVEQPEEQQVQPEEQSVQPEEQPVTVPNVPQAVVYDGNDPLIRQVADFINQNGFDLNDRETKKEIMKQFSIGYNKASYIVDVLKGEYQEQDDIQDDQNAQDEENQPIQEQIVSEQDFNDAMNLLLEGLSDEGLSHAQTVLPASNPKIIQAGISIMLHTMQNGSFTFDDAVRGVYQSLVDAGLNDNTIQTLEPYFKQWYGAATLNPTIGQYADRFTSTEDVRNANVEEIIARYVHENKTPEEKQEEWEAFKQDYKQKNGLNAIFESVEDLLEANVKDNDKIGIIDRDTKEVILLNVVSTENGKVKDATDASGILIIKDGVQLTQDQIERLRQNATLNKSDQQSSFDRLNEQIDKDNEEVIGVTSHDYFIEHDGKMYVYKRVHTVNGDQYYEDPNVVDKQNADKTDILSVLRNEGIDKVREAYGQLNGFDNYVKALNDGTITEDEFAEALASIKNNKGSNPSTQVGNIADFLVRTYFDEDPNSIQSLDYNTLTVELDGKTYKISDFMTKSVFDSFMLSMKELKETYDNLGYKISTRKHTWHNVIQLSDGSYQRVAGETDLIAVDREGKYHIIDTKTSNKSFDDQVVVTPAGNVTISPFTDAHDLFDGRKAKRSTKQQYEMQLTTYMLLMEASMPGIEFANNPLEILPINVKYIYNSVQHTIDNPSLSNKPITRMDNGRKGERARFHIDVDTNIYNGVVTQEQDLSERISTTISNLRELNSSLQEFKEQVDELIQYINDNYIVKPAINDYRTDIDQIQAQINSFSQMLMDEVTPSTLDSIDYAIAESIQKLQDLNNRFEAEQASLPAAPVVPNTTVDQRQNDFNAILQQYNKVYQAYQAYVNATDKATAYVPFANELAVLNQMVDQFKNSYNNVTEFDGNLGQYISQFNSTSAPAVNPAPVQPQNNPSTGMGWKDYNTIDNMELGKSVAEDDSTLKLADVSANADFDQKAIVEVVGVPYVRGAQTVIPIKITYDGHTYTEVHVQVANNAKGQAIIQQLNEAITNKNVGDRVILTGMDRTAGQFKRGTRTNVVGSALIQGMSLYDISTESTQSMFGLSKKVKGSNTVRVVCQGNTSSGERQIYTFPNENQGKPGTVFALIKPAYNNATQSVEPLASPLINTSLTEQDIDTLIDLLRNYKNDDYYVTLSTGEDVKLPLTRKELIEMFIPIGEYDGKYNKATYVKMENNIVTFTSPFGPQIFDLSIQGSENAMRQYLRTVRINVRQDIIDCRLGEATKPNHPFGRLSTWFQRHPSEKQVRIGNSRMVFDITDFYNPSDKTDTKGLSGLAWMMKCGMFETDYYGINYPRVSFNGAEIETQAQDQVDEHEELPVESESSDNEFSIDDIDLSFGDDADYYHIQFRDAKHKINKEKVIKNLQKIFGKNVPVEVVENIYDTNGKLIPGVVGKLYGDIIRICERAEEGTEYHEAFHRVSLLLLPNMIRKQLYKGIKRALKRKYGSKFAEEATDKQIEEFGANECARYFLRNENVVSDIKHPLEFIRGHYNAYKKVGSLRMYLLYAAMNAGMFKNMESRNKNIPNAYKFQSHGVGFEFIYDDKMYDTVKRSLLYYIMYAQVIRKDGKNIDKLDLSKDIFEKKYKLKSIQRNKQGNVIYENGKPKVNEFEETVKSLMLKSCKSELGKQAMLEVIDKWDVVKQDLITYIADLGINYQETQKSGEIVNSDQTQDIENDNNLLTGDVEDIASSNIFGRYEKSSNEYSRLVKATTGIRFFTSMIKKWDRDANGKQIESRNELGMYEFMDSKEVLNIMFNDLHDCDTPTEMIDKIKALAKTDRMYQQIYSFVGDVYKHQESKDGKVNANSEQFITQLFNLMASYKMVYKRISANKNKKTGLYAIKVEDCGQDYEAMQSRRNWGRLLIYGGTPLFQKDENGKLQLKNEHSIEWMGSIFDKLSQIKAEFQQDNIERLLGGKESKLVVSGRTINITKDEDLAFLKERIVSMFNFIGIEFSMPEFDYMLKKKYQDKGAVTDFEKLRMFFEEGGNKNIENLWNSKIRFITKVNGKWQINIDVNGNIMGAYVGKERKPTPAEYIYDKNSFCYELSKYKYMYQHETTDMSVLVGNGDRYYCVSENNLISDVTNDINKGGSYSQMLAQYCYNLIESVETNANGDERASRTGSLILKAVKEAAGKKLGLSVCTFVQFKTNDKQDQGSGYFDISEREDYTAKAAILEQGNIVFPTMSDKKSWCFLQGITIPGIHYGTDMDNNITVESYDEDAVLEQLVEYAETEYHSVVQTIKQIEKMSESEKVENFHKGGKGTTVVDKNGVSHTVAQGTLFSSFTGVYDRDGNLISFNRLLDENGNFISAEKNVERFEKYFMKLTKEQQKQVIKRTLDKQTEREIAHLEKLGLVEKDQYGLIQNVGLNNDAITQLARAMFKLPSTQNPNHVQMSQATNRYVRDIVSKSIISIQEVERLYSGNPAFFKFKYSKDGKLVDRKTDEFKRFGGLISTGTNNNTEIKGMPKDGMYVCAEVDNDKIGSDQIDFIEENMTRCEWMQAYRQLFEVSGKKEMRELSEKISSMSTEELEQAVLQKDKKVHDIIAAKAKQEAGAYKKDIDVADGGAYISPEMTEWLLRMCGMYDRKIQKAFELLKNPKVDIRSKEAAEAYKLVTTKVIGAQKYTAFGMRMSSDGLTAIPYYNKMALFPVFKCIAHGNFAKIYDQMDKDGVHMLMIHSAVKVGGQGSQPYSTDDSFHFNTYKESFKFVRKQFNTDPHHKDEQSMGTQMVKVALSSLVESKKYIDSNGKEIYGDELLSRIMKNINNLSEDGKAQIMEQLFDVTGEVDQEKLSKFLKEQLSSRDADKSILDSIQSVVDHGIAMLKHPLSAVSRMNWLQSILTSFINKRIIDVNTPGNAFYQRSVWNMEGKAHDVMTDEFLPEDLNGGEPLKMIIEDGPAKGAMDCMLTIDYFAEVLKEAGLENASFEEQRQALIDSKIIGKDANANLIGYRIPTQAQSSIHPLRCVDVIPVIQHNIILPKEFTRITGSDFDIDKIFIASLNFNMQKDENGKYVQTNNFTERQKYQNQLINDYITVLKDEEGIHIAQRSIDNDTDLLTDVLADIEEGNEPDSEVQPYDFYCLRTHTESKNDFLTGKVGIGPFALNNNSQILTMLYHVSFKIGSVMGMLGHSRLDRFSGDDNQSILSWISALINGHVDIAKDPYVSRLNINQMTYNLTNLLIRTGYGRNTFYFLKQPVMVAMSNKYRQAQGKFMQEDGKSSYQLQKEAKYKAAVEYCGEQYIKDAQSVLLDENGKFAATEEAIKVMKMYLENQNDVTRKMAKGQIEGDQLKRMQAYVYVIDSVLERPAQSISDLVQYSKIDTKKQGKNVSEQIAYLKGVAKTFGDTEILDQLYGRASTENEEEQDDEFNSDFEKTSIQNMYRNSFIYKKTHDAIFTFMKIINGQIFEATPGFQNIVDRIAGMLNKSDATSISKISDAVDAKLKAEAINQYAKDQGIDIPGLVSGNNTIYDRLNALKCKIKSDPAYAHMLDGQGHIKNALLDLLISDKHWVYNHALHKGCATDKFGNLKFVRLFDALDQSSSKTDYIIQSWDDLLSLPESSELYKFARDLCVYAFVTSGDKGGRTKMFQYVPNSFREKSGYVDYIREKLEELKDPQCANTIFSNEFVDDVILNNCDDSTFVPTVKLAKKEKDDVEWRTVGANVNINYEGDRYTPAFPIFMTTSPKTPINDDEIHPYIKIKRDNSYDDSSREFVVFKLVATVPSETKGQSIPIYVKVNPRGYHIEGGYDFYEYGDARIADKEYIPSITGIINMYDQIKKDIDKFKAIHGTFFEQIIDQLYATPISPMGQQSESWVGLNRTYAPRQTQQTEQKTDDKLQPQQKKSEVLEEIFNGQRNKEVTLTDDMRRVILKHIENDKLTDHDIEMYHLGSLPRKALIEMVKAMFDYYDRNHVVLHLQHMPEGENNPAGGIQESRYGSLEEAEHNPIVYFTSVEGNNDWLMLIHEMLHGITMPFSQWDAEGRAFDDPRLETMYNLYVKKSSSNHKEDFYKILNAKTEEDLLSIRRSVRDIYHAHTSVSEFMSSFISYKAVQLETRSIKQSDTWLFEDMVRYIKDLLRKIFQGHESLQEDVVINAITDFLLQADLSKPHGFQSEEARDKFYNAYDEAHTGERNIADLINQTPYEGIKQLLVCKNDYKNGGQYLKINSAYGIPEKELWEEIKRRMDELHIDHSYITLNYGQLKINGTAKSLLLWAKNYFDDLKDAEDAWKQEVAKRDAEAHEKEINPNRGLENGLEKIKTKDDVKNILKQLGEEMLATKCNL